MNISEAFRKALDYYVKTSKGGQTRLSKKVNVTPQQISAILNKRTDGSEILRRKIAEVYGFEYEKFLEFGNQLIKKTGRVLYQGGVDKGSIIAESGNGADPYSGLNIITIDHQNIIREFKQKKLALDINRDLLEIEKMNPDRLIQLANYIEQVRAEEKANMGKIRPPEKKTQG